MGSTIVLGYDGSDCAKAALQAAVENAKAFGDAIVVAFGAGVYPIGEDSDHMRLVRKIGADWADEAPTAIRAAGVTDAETTVVDARPAEALLQVAADRSAGMIVVGTHGEHPLTGAVLGSVPHKLPHLSEVPVLVVPVHD
ncbi:MAG TPA: universal stress protein [Gaiellales bacterium]|jgi:nucleotide-binding universal stress UspA family protein